MKVGEIFRYSRDCRDPNVEFINELPNFYHVTATPNKNRVQLESGINPVAIISASDGPRTPVIAISSSPHKVGSVDTPWQDIYDPDNGHIRYFGDNKKPGSDPSASRGNKKLLEQFGSQTSPIIADRHKAAPIVFFRRVPHSGRAKGNVMFQGVAIISAVERVTQIERRTGEAFANYRYDFTVVSLQEENEVFDWRWISARREPALTSEEANKFAPAAWRKWIKEGVTAESKVRRRVSDLQLQKTRDQKPESGSDNENALKEIYRFYSTSAVRKKRFEALAEIVAEQVLSRSGSYRRGWLTAASADGGADFIGRLDIGEGFGTAKIIVLGQAKCESLGSPTGGNHIARTVARLRRGWVGAYVTTSYFSESVQREVIEDKYPILLINGLLLAETVRLLAYEVGASVVEFLEQVDSTYESRIRSRNPEEILLD